MEMVLDRQNSPGFWAKKFYMASRTAMEAVLRPHDLGSTQWYVLWHLANEGPKAQRDLLRLLEIEKPTLSTVIAALVRKGFVSQTTDPRDQRQKMLALTPAGFELWQGLPDPVELILKTAFDGVAEEDVSTVNRVLSEATKRLQTKLV
jgi:DNA-binding MarR family transcriptional regulator